jgi:sortase A
MDRLTYPDIARIFGTGLISTGVGLLLFVLVTIVWGDPFTRWSADGAQDKLAREIAASAPDDLQDAALLDYELTRRQAFALRKQLKPGDPVGRIFIPRIKMKRVFVYGAGHDQLTKGPGIYRQVLFPGSGRAVAIAGHRTTYGAPFLNVDKMRVHDPIVLTLPYGRFTYRVTRKAIIKPTDWSIIEYGAEEPTATARAAVRKNGRCFGTCEHLVLTACHPKYSAAQRIADFAKLTKVELAT